MIVIAILLQVAAPSADVGELSRRVAESGALVRLLPTVATKEAGELVEDHPELSAAEKAQLHGTAQAVAADSRGKLVAAMAPSYAKALTVPQMQAIVAFEESDAAKLRRAAELPAMMAATKVLEGFDFKGTVLKTFCAKTGKACPTAK